MATVPLVYRPFEYAVNLAIYVDDFNKARREEDDSCANILINEVKDAVSHVIHVRETVRRT